MSELIFSKSEKREPQSVPFVFALRCYNYSAAASAGASSAAASAAAAS